ncbi:MAG: hypothetical protein J7K85_09465 [Anaerolineaceae bacterium]|nr:hypothetical protein [Anaerolineaceae bacterium]
MNRKRQVDIETGIRWILGSFFWLISDGFLVLIANRFMVTLNSYYSAVVTAKERDSIVGLQGEIMFFDRAILFILTLIVGTLIVYLFFKFIDPGRLDNEIFMIEDHEYFSQPWFKRIDLLRILKLFLIVGFIGMGVWLLTWVAMLILSALT